MLHYRISKEAFDVNDIVLGVDNYEGFDSVDKLNEGFKKMNPDASKVPYYNKKTLYAFRSYDAIMTFLFSICKMTYEDIQELENLGYKLYKCELEVYSSAFSVFYSTFFKDECSNYEEYNLTSLFDENENALSYNIIKQPKVEF